jgi:hypothetical protein
MCGIDRQNKEPVDLADAKEEPADPLIGISRVLRRVKIESTSYEIQQTLRSMWIVKLPWGHLISLSPCAGS